MCFLDGIPFGFLCSCSFLFRLYPGSLGFHSFHLLSHGLITCDVISGLQGYHHVVLIAKILIYIGHSPIRGFVCLIVQKRFLIQFDRTGIITALLSQLYVCIRYGISYFRTLGLVIKCIVIILNSILVITRIHIFASGTQYVSHLVCFGEIADTVIYAQYHTHDYQNNRGGGDHTFDRLNIHNILLPSYISSICQSISLSPLLLRNSFARPKCLHPKKPL